MERGSRNYLCWEKGIQLTKDTLWTQLCGEFFFSTCGMVVMRVIIIFISVYMSLISEPKKAKQK